MNFEIFKKINDEKKNCRIIENPTLVIDYKKDSCGDDYRLFLKIENEKIVDIGYQTTGCGFSVMALEAVCQLSKCLTLEEAKKIDLKSMNDFFLLPERRQSYYESGLSVLKKALN